MNWPAVSAILLALAVALGAFGAHGLRARLEASGLASVYEKAVFYHFIHALGIFLVSILAKIGALAPAAQGRVAWLLLAGIVFFSGSLYLLALSEVRVLGAITPIGGISLLAGWVLLAIELFRSRG
jgi:uncharacterized membrane protein YgdD (TMEM256/DUF423 family)